MKQIFIEFLLFSITQSFIPCFIHPLIQQLLEDYSVPNSLLLIKGWSVPSGSTAWSRVVQRDLSSLGETHAEALRVSRNWLEKEDECFRRRGTYEPRLEATSGMMGSVVGAWRPHRTVTGRWGLITKRIRSRRALCFILRGWEFILTVMRSPLKDFR